MFNFLTPVFIIGFICACIYGLFELFVRKSERLAMIEQLGEKLNSSDLQGKIKLPNLNSRLSFSALKTGCLLMGIGLGLLIGFLIVYNLNIAELPGWDKNDTIGLVYTSCVLLCGGLALIIAFLIEINITNKRKEE